MFTSKKKREAAFLKNHGKVKQETFYFNKINRYFEGVDKSNVRQVISEKISNDLNLDELFMHIDRTASKVGQQYLYYLLRTIPRHEKRALKLESLIKYFEENPEQKERILLKTHSLHKEESYYISGLFLDTHLQKPKWFWAIYALAGTSVGFFFLAFFYPPFFLLLIGILAVNYFIHYWNKNNLFRYAEALPQLLILNRVAKQIANIQATPEDNIKLENCFKSIDSLGKQMMLFKLEAKLQSDVGAALEYFVEIIKALFLIEPIVLFNILKEIDLKRKEIEEIFQYVGEMDVAISILSLRQNLPFFTIPSITEKRKRISAIDIYHPLIEDCVYNSIELDNKSALLTGSNMSGKTTFIRTIGINAITAQTINTCFAREFEMPTLNIHSAISVSDDLMNEKSYYFEEVLTIKDMIIESRSGNQNLFLLDEMFKGTNTVERIAGGKSVLDYLNSDNNFVIISTHDLEMTEYLKDTFNLYHFTEDFKDDSITFDYKLKPGNLKTTNAIRILELNQYPPEIIKEARRLSNEINSKKTSKF